MRIAIQQVLLTLAFALPVLTTGGAWAGGIEVIRDVTYSDDGEDSGERHLADVYVPPGDGPFPGVLMVHGGAWTHGDKAHMLRHARVVAGAGYTVASINYRLAPKHHFPAQIDDCRTALRWLRANAKKYKIDPGRISGYGYSAGAHLVCLLGTASEGKDARLQCVIAGGSPCDFRKIPENLDWLSYWLGGTRAEKPEAYRLASPAAFVTADDPPTFFFHGEKDRLVPLTGPRAMSRQLQRVDVKSELMVLDGSGHIGAFLAKSPPHEAVKFLDVVLKGKERLAEN